MNQEPLFIGIDVGTGSARAAIFDTTGNQIAAATKETQTWRSDDDPRVFEQSTNDIWNAICSCVRQAMQQSGASKESIKGIGFDATCSLAVTDDQAAPVCVTSGPKCGDLGERNIILWADHRAEQEANLINSTGSVVLDYVGGSMSVSSSQTHSIHETFHRQFSVGNGDPEDSVAKEKYARSKIQQVSIF
jgi:ribulose kinase